MNNSKKFSERMFAINLILKGYDFSREPEKVAKRLWQCVLDIYWEALKEHPDDIVNEALSEGVKERWKWFPKPAEINELCEQVKQRKSRTLESAQHERELLE